MARRRRLAGTLAAASRPLRLCAAAALACRLALPACALLRLPALACATRGFCPARRLTASPSSWPTFLRHRLLTGRLAAFGRGLSFFALSVLLSSGLPFPRRRAERPIGDRARRRGRRRSRGGAGGGAGGRLRRAAAFFGADFFFAAACFFGADFLPRLSSRASSPFLPPSSARTSSHLLLFQRGVSSPSSSLFDFFAFFLRAAMMILLTVHRATILRRSRAVEKPSASATARILRRDRNSSRLIHTTRTCASASGTGPPCAQSSSSTVCTTGIAVAGAIWVMQPMLPVAITSAPVASMFATLRSRSARGDVGLHDVVGSGRAAAQMRLGDVAHLEAGACQQVLGLPHDFLPVLERAGGLVGDLEAARTRRRAEVERREILAKCPARAPTRARPSSA